MQTMLAAVLDSAPGGLRVEEIPVPEPRANEILVKVHACGVCHTDLHVMKAEVAFPTPAVMGHEITGTVAALGPGSRRPARGLAGGVCVRHAVRLLHGLRGGPRRPVRQLLRA